MKAHIMKSPEHRERVCLFVWAVVGAMSLLALLRRSMLVHWQRGLLPDVHWFWAWQKGRAIAWNLGLAGSWPLLRPDYNKASSARMRTLS